MTGAADGVNRLISSLPVNLSKVLTDAGQRAGHQRGDEIFRIGERVDTLTFPYSGLISLTVSTTDGDTVEVAVVGHEGFVGQLEMLEGARLAQFGGGRNLLAARRPLILERKGVRIALLAYNDFQREEFAATDAAPGVAPLEIEQVVADIEAARAIDHADVVIPFLHWGPELTPQPRECWASRNTAVK